VLLVQTEVVGYWDRCEQLRSLSAKGKNTRQK